MDAEIKRTVISNIGFKIRDTTAAQPGWREEREITGDSAQFAMPWPTLANRSAKGFQNPGNGQPCRLLPGTLTFKPYDFPQFFWHQKEI